jgi:hypothetical protein
VHGELSVARTASPADVVTVSLISDAEGSGSSTAGAVPVLIAIASDTGRATARPSAR